MARWDDLHWATTVYAAPAVEPITVAEAKAQCRIDSSQGEPAPTAPTAALPGTPVAGNVDNGAHRYGCTYVTADGETELGTVTAAVTVADKTVNGKISLTAIPIGGAAVTARKVYRTVAGGTTYLLLTTLADNSTTTYTDNTADSSLGAAAPSTNTTADPELIAWIATARELTEDWCGRAWITQTHDLSADGFPSSSTDPIRVPRLPLISVTSISYVDEAGATQTWSNTLYDVDVAGGRIAPKYGQTYPTTRIQQNAVTVRFVCGYGAAASAVPAPARAAMKLLIGHWWSNREAVNIGNIVTELDLGVQALLSPLKVSF